MEEEVDGGVPNIGGIEEVNGAAEEQTLMGGTEAEVEAAALADDAETKMDATVVESVAGLSTGADLPSVAAPSDESVSVPVPMSQGTARNTILEAPSVSVPAPSVVQPPQEAPDAAPAAEVAIETPAATTAPVVAAPVEPEPPKRDPNLVAITLRPMDKDWVMGEDWIVDFHNMTTIVDIRAFIEKERGISRHRMQLRLKGKVLAPNREIWTLRRLGIYDGYMIQVEPTLSGAWLWEPKQYYIDRLLNEVCAVVEAAVSPTGSGRINMKVLSALIKPPPCIKSSLRVFLRQYPERVYIHTDTTDNDLWVHVTSRPYQLPTFGNFSVEIGAFPYYKPKPFNWEANKDIDDMYKIETLPDEEEEAIAAAVAAAAAEEAERGGAGGVAESKTQEQVEEEIARFAAMNAGDEENTAELVEESQLADDSLVTGLE
jgi:hypothetical protein